MKYKIVERIIPGGSNKGKRKQSFSFSHDGRVSFDELVKRISDYGICGGDVYRFTYILKDIIRQELERGKSVEIKDLGTFGLSVKYKEGESGDIGFNRRNIRDVKIVFKPSKKMKINIDKLSFRNR